MIHQILIPLDGSKLAEAALPVAAHIATLSGAELRLVLVHQPESSIVPVGESAVLVAEDDRVRREFESTYLRQVLDRFHLGTKDGVATEIIDGTPGPALAELIRLARPDLVVLATHGRGPMGRFLLGSVTDYLLRHVSAPLLVLKQHEGPPEPELRLGSILVALDLTDASRCILDRASDLALLTRARLTLVHVLQPPLSNPASGVVASFDPRAAEKLFEAAKGEMDRIAHDLRGKGLEVDGLTIVGVTVPGAITRLAEREGYDLVALTTHGRGGLSRAFIGSVADKVIRTTECPILVVRPPD
jgi:nucleotide-binding universal stress UspA family protein